jgi:hypothetical protein
MYVTLAKPEHAIGHILLHNMPDAQGHKAFAKGHRVMAADVDKLRALDVQQLHVAVLQPGDVGENEAAARIAATITGPDVAASMPAAGRVNLLAAADGVVEVDIERLLQINLIDGVTVAALREHTLVRPKERVATIKIIPFALPAEALQQVEAIGRQGDAVVGLRKLLPAKVGVLLVGSVRAHARLERMFLPAITPRIHDVGAAVQRIDCVEPSEHVVATALLDLQRAGATLVIIAGQTSTVDGDDITPRAIKAAGGVVEHIGAPVEPGNLLLLAYLRDAHGRIMPIIGAPGCVRGRGANVVDLLLPRLVAGEHPTKRDIVMLGHGGLLSS